MSRTWNELLVDDHQVTERAIAAVENALAQPAGPAPALVGRALDYFTGYVDRCHNQKEERHLFPLMERHGVPRQGGPLAVMLAEHEQARALLARLTPVAEAYAAGERGRLEELRAVFHEYGNLLKDHFWKENDILYPMARRVMSPEDGAAVVAGIEAIEASIGPEIRAHYYALADALATAGEVKDLSHGLDRDTLAAILNSLPIELSFVDVDDTVRYFSHENGDKIFPRNRSAIGTAVQNCHPRKSLHVVNRILEDFRAGSRDVAEFWIDMGGRKIHIRYWPVRSPDGAYLGCLETVQDVTAIQKLEGQRRLLDGGPPAPAAATGGSR